jgi:hypothetical protein
MYIANVYNYRTGASITHLDVEEWGYVETEKIIAALEFWDME